MSQGPARTRAQGRDLGFSLGPLGAWGLKLLKSELSKKPQFLRCFPPSSGRFGGLGFRLAQKSGCIVDETAIATHELVHYSILLSPQPPSFNPISGPLNPGVESGEVQMPKQRRSMRKGGVNRAHKPGWLERFKV